MEFTGKTVEEATELGLKELGLTEKDAIIQIIEEPSKGLFGKIKGQAVVDITKKPVGIEKAVITIQNILDLMDITAKAVIEENCANPTINLIAEKSSQVIGYRGEVLDALQTIASAIANTDEKNYKKIVVNCENYREKREETLIALAHRLELKATELRRKVLLEAMNPFERRIIHTALAESETVKTESEGVEPNRYVVIIPNELDENSKPYNAGRNNKDSKNNGKINKYGQKKGGFKKKSGFTSTPKKTSFGFGTYLGNSIKDKI